MSLYNFHNRFVKIISYYGFTIREIELPIHSHDFSEIMYVTDNSCIIEIENKPITLSKNEFVFIDSNVSHRLLVNKGANCNIMCIEFSCSEAGDGIDIQVMSRHSKSVSMFLAEKKPYVVLNDTSNLYRILSDLISELNNHNNDEYINSIFFARVLIELCRCATKDAAPAGPAYLKKAREYIYKNYTGELTVADVAQAAGINQAYLQTLFKKHFGCGIITYANNYRLEKARFLLRNTKKHITDIAFEVGFNSRQHFGYTFEKYYNMTPLRYRKQYGNFAELKSIIPTRVT